MAAVKEHPPRLCLEYGLEAGRVIELTAERFVIGRAADCDLQIPDQRLSRHHAEVLYEAEQYLVADLGSRNGTFLNGQRLGRERQRLYSGDEIQLGSLLVARFEDPAGTAVDLPSRILSRGLWLNASRHEVYVRYQRLDPPLPEKLFKLLEILVEHRGEVVTKDQIAQRVWPEAKGGVTDQMIDSLVARLRRRLAQVDDQHQYIVRVRNQGLKFVQGE